MNTTDLDEVKQALMTWLQTDYDVRRMVFEAVKDEAKLEGGVEVRRVPSTANLDHPRWLTRSGTREPDTVPTSSALSH